MKRIKKPPLGLTPKYLWDEKRLNELQRVIADYYNANLQINVDWIEEYNELIIKRYERK